MTKHKMLTVLIALLFVLAACSAPEPVAPAAEPAAATQSDDAMADDHAMSDDSMAMDDKSDDAMMDDKSDDAMMDDKSDDAMMADDKGDDAVMADDHAAGDDSMAMDDKSDDAMMDDKDGDAMMDDKSDDAMAARPAWQQISLVDARTGAAFTLADFAGRTVFVEPMATWCTNCRRQLQNVREARAQLGDDVVFIALSLETNLTAGMLADYANNEGFDWTFAVMTPEMLTQLADAFGRTITNAPSTPHFIIRPDGTVTDLVTGIDSPAELVDMVRAAQG